MVSPCSPIKLAVSETSKTSTEYLLTVFVSSALTAKRDNGKQESVRTNAIIIEKIFFIDNLLFYVWYINFLK